MAARDLAVGPPRVLKKPFPKSQNQGIWLKLCRDPEYDLRYIPELSHIGLPGLGNKEYRY